MRNGEFERNEIESIPNRRHHHYISSPEQRHSLLQAHLRFRTFLELNGAGPPIVDVGHHRHYLISRFSIVITAFKCRYADLNQYDLPSPLRTTLKETFKSNQLQWNTFQ
mmetsp:Transcript_30592/g.62940  ORF Transcript_30592/g.62940 Transcript_30592/m.62940 type:complete len:109 (-) Transcript_30592:864-1190(-)